MANKINVTRNVQLELIVDANKDNWIQISGFEAGTLFANWKYEVSNHKGSAKIFETDSAGYIVVDLTEMTVKLNIPAGSIPEGIYYHNLYADTEDASLKFSFGGINELKVVKF